MKKLAAGFNEKHKIFNFFALQGDTKWLSQFKQVKGKIKKLSEGLIFDRFRCLPSER